jgi:hypothetical protein
VAKEMRFSFDFLVMFFPAPPSYHLRLNSISQFVLKFVLRLLYKRGTEREREREGERERERKKKSGCNNFYHRFYKID